MPLNIPLPGAPPAHVHGESRMSAGRLERWNNTLGRWQSRQAFAGYELNRVGALKTKIITPPVEEQREVATKKQSLTLGDIVLEKDLVPGNIYAVSSKDLHTFPLLGATHQVRTEPIINYCTIRFKRLVKNAGGEFRSLIGPSYESVSIRPSAQILEVKIVSNS